MREVKLTIDGKDVQLADEQREALYREYHRVDNPFDRVPISYNYFYIDSRGTVFSFPESNDSVDGMHYDAINYFNDEKFANQVALHQLLYRKLLKFAYDNKVIDTGEWNGENEHWAIRYNSYRNEFRLYYQDGYKAHEVYFSSEEGAKRAINEVVEPFMKEHPEFVW